MHKHRKGSIPLGIRDEFVAVSDHIAYFWETDAEFADGVPNASLEGRVRLAADEALALAGGVRGARGVLSSSNREN